MLEAVGFRSLLGYLSGGIAAWQDAGFDTDSTPAIDVPTLAEHLKAGDVTLLDVREDDEWRDGPVDGSLHVPYHQLRDGAPRGWRLHSTASRSRSSARPATAARSPSRCSTGTGSKTSFHVTDGGVADLTQHGIELVKGGA